MKTYALAVFFLIISGCSTLSQSEKKELTLLKCQKMANQILDLRQLASESSIVSLGYAMAQNGFPTSVAYSILELSQSSEAKEAYQLKYSKSIEELSFQILENNGCLKVLEDNYKKDQDEKELNKDKNQNIIYNI